MFQLSENQTQASEGRNRRQITGQITQALSDGKVNGGKKHLRSRDLIESWFRSTFEYAVK